MPYIASVQRLLSFLRVRPSQAHGFPTRSVSTGATWKRNLIAIAILAVGSTTAVKSQAQSYSGGKNSRALVVQPVDESKLATLYGNTRPEAIPANDKGAVADSLPLDHLQLFLQRPPELEKELDTLIQDQQRKGSPNYHKWLTAAEFGDRFGLAQKDVEAVSNWLKNKGFQVDSVFTNGMTIEFSGNAGQLKNAFHTEIHNLEVRGEKHIANMSDPRVPAALAPAIGGIYSLNDFQPHKMLKKRKQYTTGGSQWPYLVAPADLATLYNLNPVFAAGYTGTGQTIVVVEDTNVYDTADWDTFRSTFGLTGYTNGSFTQVHPAQPATGGAACSNPGVNGDEDEAILDAQWASAAAPDATIVLASCTGGRSVSAFGGLIAIENINNGAPPYPQVLSMSYGESEPDDGAAGNLAFKTALQQSAAQGISVFVSSGDELAASSDGGDYSATRGINVSGWMSSIYNVSVGGTDFADAYLAQEGNPPVQQSTYWSSTNTAAYGSLLSYLPETTWTNSCTSALFDTFNSTTAAALCNVAGQSTAEIYDSYGGSGGPSNCATGTASTSGVASGTCAGYSKPVWQVAPGVPADGVRDTPDLALMASNGQWGHYYPSCDSDPADAIPPAANGCTGTPDNWAGGGGTSFSSPIMAGIQALINEATGNTTGVGNPNPRYYQLGALEYGSSAGLSACNSLLGAGIGSTCVFNDITLGDITSACSARYSRGSLVGTFNCYGSGGTSSAPVYGISSLSNSTQENAYETGAGWDFGTGLGSVNAYNMIQNWNAVVTSTGVGADPSPAIAGQSVTLTATITPNIGDTETGSVNWSTNTGCSSSTVTGGVATCTTSSLPAGTDTVTATYSGDTNYAGSGGTLTGLVVNIAVPNVVGDSESAAESAITSDGLDVGKVTTASSSTVPIGDVISETPAANTPVAPGKAICLVISTGVDVPDVVGEAETAASSAITGIGLSVGTVTTQTSVVAVNHVISQSPAPGTAENGGTPVNLVISSGPGGVSVVWPTPAPIVYGTGLSTTQLDATANVAGSFVYNPPAGTVLAAGQHTLDATFTPADTAEPTVLKEVKIEVEKATPVVQWNPAPIQIDTKLTSAQLDATANVPGKFVYTPALGTKITSSTATVKVVFTPTKSADENTVTKTVSLEVKH
ncbi:MAG: protease pro-enzyme activation domain-containing protein [Terracidiphilus sp.]|jgi:subtilase family serine protease